jgi:O-antigen/teichoic acid export membrane protein
LWRIYRDLPKPNSGDERLRIAENIRVMFKYGLPLSLSSILIGFLAQFYNFLIPIYATDLMIGNYSVATNFIVLISFFATPIATMMFPAFSKLEPQKEKETLQNVFQYSVKYSALIVVPVATAIIALSQPAVSTLFGEKYTEAPLFLTLLAISYLYAAFGSLSIGNLLNSQGETRLNLKLTLITIAIGFTLSIVLIPQFGITGLIATMLTSGLPSLIISIHWIRKHYTVTVDWTSSAKILLSSSVAAIVAYTLLSLLSFSSWMKLVIGLVVFLPTLLLGILLTRTIGKSDIDNLREMTSELGTLSKVVKPILNMIEKLLTSQR